MHRFFVENIEDGNALLTGSDAAHCARVLRLRAGDAARLCDGRGNEYDAVIESASAEECLLAVGEPFPSETEPKCRVTLYQCLPKTGKAELIVQKCVELGVDTVELVLSARCVAQPSKNDAAKLARLNRVSEEAAKQSRRGVIPPVAGITPIDALDPAAFDLFLIAYEEERAVSLKAALLAHPAPGSVALLVGPEGGLTEEEVATLTRRGARAVSLGTRILRTETAGMAALAQLLYEVEA